MKLQNDEQVEVSKAEQNYSKKNWQSPSIEVMNTSETSLNVGPGTDATVGLGS